MITHPIKVYVVEDSPAIRSAIIDRLEEDDRFAVIGYAETANDAIAEVDEVIPDVLILDLQLKQGTGYDVLQHLSAPAAPAIEQVIMLTNNATKAHRQHALSLGATHFYDKSMQFDEMLHELQAWADGSRGIQ